MLGIFYVLLERKVQQSMYFSPISKLVLLFLLTLLLFLSLLHLKMLLVVLLLALSSLLFS